MRRPNPRIFLSRSDIGCGGWSLHCHIVANDEWPYLVSGDGRWVRGEWADPPKSAYARARRLAREIHRKTPVELES